MLVEHLLLWMLFKVAEELCKTDCPTDIKYGTE
jgi:hypothetical protein